jgi:hypothetical protein
VVVSDQAPTPGATTSVGPAASTSAGPGHSTGANGHGVSQGAATLVQGADETGIPAGFGLAVISGLADDVHVSSTSSGVSVRMSWPSATPA